MLPAEPQADRHAETCETDTVLALRALAFVASQPALIERFMALTGLSPAQIRSRAQDPALLVGLLDFLLAHEPDLHAFCAAAGCEPAAAANARARLASDAGITSV